jgi:transcriptional regulator with XRE-family HTH domain
MRASAAPQLPLEKEPVRVLGRGLRAQRGVRLTARVVREATGKTQLDVAAAARMDQADVSRLESREDFGDCQVSTLERYVAALGGALELVAVFANKRIALCGVERRDTPADSPLQRPRSAKARHRSPRR